MNIDYIPAFARTDSYKLSHKGFMEPGTETIYSNMTARNMKYMPVDFSMFDGKVVVFGIQKVIVETLMRAFDRTFFDLPEDLAIGLLSDIFDPYLGEGAVCMDHFRELHRLGYLPIRIKSLPEGSLVPAKVAFFTIRNTHKRFAWLTNFLETVISCELWKAMTVATIIRQYRLLVNEWALKTTGSTAGTEWQIHGFEYRGMSNTADAAFCASAFLLSSFGTDTIPALCLIREYYGEDLRKTFIASSVPASEHSLASTGIAVRGELETYRKWMTIDYPTGIVSIIADTLDFFRVVTEFARLLKDDILNRKPNALGLAKVVFRPDSGCPVKILTGYTDDEIQYDDECDNMLAYCKATGRRLLTAEIKGAVECLWDIFGGTTTEQGYRVLHERVGLIYGDSITIERAKLICERLAEKKFASTNAVYGVGSFTSQYLTRDSAGMAVKATAAEVNGQWFELSKDPVTDDGTKKSAKGLLRVELVNGEYVMYDQQTAEQEEQGELKTVFENGVLTAPVRYTEIRNRLWPQA